MYGELPSPAVNKKSRASQVLFSIILLLLSGNGTFTSHLILYINKYQNEMVLFSEPIYHSFVFKNGTQRIGLACCK